MKKQFFVGLLLSICLLQHSNASNCALWTSKIVQNDTSVCNSAIVYFDIRVHNDSMNLDSCKYEWFIKSPNGSFVSQGNIMDSSLSYIFNQSGVYNVTCQVTPDTCNSFFSDTISVTVYSVLTAGAIFSNDTICYNTHPEAIQSVALPTGCDGQYVYQWQDSVSGGIWRDIPNSNNTTYQPGSLTETTYYRRKVTNVLCSETEYTQPVLISVFSPLTAGTIHYEDTICYNTQPEAIQSVTLPTGCDGQYVYQWQDSVSGGIWRDIPNSNNTTYQPGSLTETTYYRRKVTNVLCSETEYTQPVLISVFSPLTSGTIHYEDTICYNTQPDAIQSVALPTGCDGQYVYQWQDSVSGGTWRDIPNSNNITYQAGNLTATTFFRRKVTNVRCGEQAFTSPVCVKVRNQIIAPVLNKVLDTICYNSVPAQVSIDLQSQVVSYDSVIFCWQYSDDCMNFVSTNQRGLIFTDTTHLKSSRYYRVKAMSLMCNDSLFSDTIKVNVFAQLTATICADTCICHQTSAALTVAVNGADGKYNYQWYESTDGYSWNAVGTNSELFNTPAYGFSIHYYKCDVTSQTGCGSVSTAMCTVTTYNKLRAGEILLYDTICSGSNSVIIQSIVNANGSDENNNYIWQKSIDRVNWQNTTGKSSSYYPGVLTQTTYFRRMVTNLLCSDTAYSNVSEIYVIDSITSPIVSQYNDTICYGSRPDSLRILTLSRCDIFDSITYLWQESVNGVQWNTVHTGITYQPSSLVTSMYYRIMAVSKRCSMVRYSNVVKVNVFDSLVITNNAIDNVCNMVPATLTFESIRGAGGRYHYQWQESTDGGVTFVDIQSSANSSTYNMAGRPSGNYYFRCVISPINNCDGGISDVFVVHVYEKFQPGLIYCPDTEVCKGENAALVSFSSRPSGGSSNYTYQWKYSEDGGVTWQDCPNETADTLHPTNMQNSTHYKVEVTDLCGTEYTNKIFIRVNPLPDSVTIVGNEIVCSNEYSTYLIDSMLEGFDYEWYLSDENVGNIITDNINKQTIKVYWNKENSSCKVYLKVTNVATLCESINSITINTREISSPDTTIIVHKPNSNILVCQEDEPIFYQWGFTDKTTKKRDTIPDSNNRYVQLPMPFDNNAYDYWLILRKTESAECYSESHYSPENDKIIAQPSRNVRVVTNVKDNLEIAIDNPLEYSVSLDIYTIAGMKLFSQELGNGVYIQKEMNVVLPQGAYFLKVVVGTEVLTYKLIAE